MKAHLKTLRMSISYEFKRRHHFKGGRFTPLDNVREYISTIRQIEKKKTYAPHKLTEGTPRHTKGDWQATGTGQIRVEGKEDAIALVTSLVPHDTEALANAHLIAAAPDLLEACHTALAAIRASFPEEHGNPVIGEAWGKLESAIKKATDN